MSHSLYPTHQSPQQRDSNYHKDFYMKSSLTKSVANPSSGSVPNQATIKKSHPFSNQQTPYTQSPNPYGSKLNYSLSASNDELDLYKIKCSELERMLNQQRNELDLIRGSSLKSNDLENKFGDVISQNHHLQSQVEKATKQAVQRKTEADLWKQKYENQMSQLVQIKSNYELEIKQISSELQKVHASMGTLECDKNRTISDSKTITESQKQSQIETIKNSQQNQVGFLEQQIKKLRDIVEDKSVQATQLQTLLERQKAEYNDMQARLKNEVEAMKNRITSIQIDHQKELETLKSKLDLYKDTQVRNVQHAYDNQTDMLVSEIEKLKHLLDIKNEEIQTLLQQNQKQKNSYDLECHDLREEINDLKDKFLENEKIHQQENHNIQVNLERMHNQEMTNVKYQHEKEVQLLNQEILKLKDIINNKNTEIEKQILEKAQQKDYYDGEIERLVTTIEDWKRKYVLLDAERNREISDLLHRIDRLNEQFHEREQQLQSQIDLLNQEIKNLKDLLNHKQNEIEQNLTNFSVIKLDLEEKIAQLKDEIEILKLKAYEMEKAKNQEIQELKMHLTELEQHSREKQKQLEIKIEHLLYELNSQKDMFNNKAKECDNLHAQRQNMELQVRKLTEENDYLIQKLQAFEQEKNLEIDELRAKMDVGASYQFENLKKAYNTQVGILSDQIADLQNKLQQKQREYTEVLEKYSVLDKSVLPSELVNHNMRNSRTGVPAEFITNKSVHDVLLKSNQRSSQQTAKKY